MHCSGPPIGTVFLPQPLSISYGNSRSFGLFDLSLHIGRTRDRASLPVCRDRILSFCQAHRGKVRQFSDITSQRMQTLNKQSPYRVLLIAEAANPEWVSVPLVGWSLSRAIADVTHAHLVTQVRNRAAILRAGLTEGEDFTAIDNEYVAAPLFKLSNLLRGGIGVGWTTASAFSSLSYYAFEREVWLKFRGRLKAGEFDIVHRITPLSPTSQSIITKRVAKLGIPFVLGPLNGGVPWPKGFIDRQHAEKEWLAHVRGLYKLLPGYRSTRKCSSAIIVGSKHTYEQMPDWAKSKCVRIPENGVDLTRFSSPRTRSASLPLRAAFVGRLVPYKGADMLLKAATEYVKRGKLQLHIIGDGPQRQALEALAGRAGIDSNVIFHGWVPHHDVQATLRDCDFLALPSVREFGGGVVIEAMALGVAPVVADYAGPAELVEDGIGLRVPFSDASSLIDGFHQAIGKLIANPKMLDDIGAAARRKVLERYTWDAKAEQVIEVYDRVIADRRKG